MNSEFSTPKASPPWWRDAVVYQVYLRSFADANGDGIGDLAGLRARLDHVQALGVDALWLNPCFASPQRDHGYDISDYMAIDPAYGTVADLEALVDDAASRGIRIIMDMVANHCSSDHAWFQAALRSKPGSRERARFHFLDGRGPQGDEPPTNYDSVFGGRAWTRIAEPDGSPGQWYLHLFDDSQPDLNWRNEDVQQHFDEVLRFWFSRGVAGFRIDVAHGMAKAEHFVDVFPGATSHPAWNQPEVHDIYRRWRGIGDADPAGERYFVGEVWVTDEAYARYVAPGQLHQAFSFDVLVQPWDAPSQRGAIERSLALTSGSAPPAWTLSNHDVHRTVTRYGQVQDLTPPDPSNMIGSARRRGPVDVALGLRRARAALLLQLALPGAVYLYQGEELGLTEYLDLPDEARQDPVWIRSGGLDYGRDGCRVPMPWDAQEPSFGFSLTSEPALPWLPQPLEYADFAAWGQRDDPDSMFAFFSRAIGLRKALVDQSTSLEWVEHGSPQVLAFTRGELACVVNFSDRDTRSPLQGTEVIASTKAPSGMIPANSALWLRDVKA